jgi:hypothetical protein
MSHFATQSDNSQQAEHRTTASSFNQHGVNKRPLLIDDYVPSTVRKVSEFPLGQHCQIGTLKKLGSPETLLFIRKGEKQTIMRCHNCSVVTLMAFVDATSHSGLACVTSIR